MKYIEIKLKELKRYYPEIYVKEANYDKDYIHLLVWIPPKMSVSQVVKLIKTNMARGMRKKFGFLGKVYYGTRSIWSKGYFV